MTRPSGPGAGDLRQVDAALAGDPPRERARLDGLALGASGRLGLLLSLRVLPRCSVIGSLGASSAPRSALLGRRRSRCVAVPALRARDERGDVLVLGADDPDRRPDVDLAVRDDDLQQDAVRLGLDLLRHLVGVELEEGLALRDRVSLGLQPAHDRAGLHALAQPWELDLGRHL